MSKHRRVALSFALALLPLSACTIHVGTKSSPTGRDTTTTTTTSASNSKRLDFNGMTLRAPYTWSAIPDGQGGGRVHVVTGGDCQKSGYPEADTCRGFWLFGADDIALGNEGGPFMAGKPFYPQSDSVPCPDAPETYQTTPNAPTVQKLLQVGTGHRGDYREWEITCISLAGGAKQGSFTKRTLYLPQSRILVVDNWETFGLTTRLEQATWY